MAERRVTDDDMRRAMADPNVARVLGSAVRRHGRGLTPDQMRECRLTALWRSLRGHEDGRGNKFTTSLYRFARYACLDLRAKEARARRRTVPLEQDVAAPPDRRQAADPRAERVREALSLLPRRQREAVLEHFLGGRTFDEVGGRVGLRRERSRELANAGLARLRELCRCMEDEPEPQTEGGPPWP